MGLAVNMLSAANRFYEAAEGRDDLSAVLADLTDLLGAECAVLEVHDREAGNPILIENARVDVAAISAYADEYLRISPRMRYAMSPGASLICHDALILRYDEINHDPYYAEFLAPMGLRYFLSVDVSPDAGRVGILSFQYRPLDGPVDAPKLRLASAMRPHLVRAMRGHLRRRNLADTGWITGDLRRAFGLTMAEAVLADSILRGERLKDHARRRQVSIATVHTHYDRLKQKLGCERQAALVSLLQRRYGADI